MAKHDAPKDETRVPMTKATRKDLKEFCDGASLPYDTVIKSLLGDIRSKYGDDLFIAGQEYRRKLRDKGKN